MTRRPYWRKSLRTAEEGIPRSSSPRKERLARAFTAAAAALLPHSYCAVEMPAVVAVARSQEMVEEESLPALGPHSDLDVLVGRFFFWADILEGRTNRITITRSAETITGMLTELGRLGRYDEVVKAAYRLHDIANPGIPYVHHALARAAVAEVRRGHLGRAAGALRLMRSVEPKDEPAEEVSAWAEVRFRRHRAAATLHLAQGSLDLAQLDWGRMEEELARVEEKRGLTAALSELELDLLLGAGRYSECWRKGRELAAAFADGPGSEDSAARLDAKARRALHLASYGDSTIREEALLIYRARIKDASLPRSVRADAAIVAAEICLDAGYHDDADAALESARDLTQGDSGGVALEIVALQVQLERGGTLSDESSNAWELQAERLLEETARSRRFLHADSNRAILAAGLRLAAAFDKGPGDLILERYLRYAGGEHSEGGLHRARSIRGQLGAGECLLIPVLSERLTTVLLVTAHSCRSFTAAPSCMFKATVVNLQRLMREGAGGSLSSEQRAEEIAAAGVALGEFLFPQDLMEALSEAGQVTIAQGALGQHLPLEFAVVQDAQGTRRPLVEAMPIAWTTDILATAAPAVPQAGTAAQPTAGRTSLALVAKADVKAEDLDRIAAPFGRSAAIDSGIEASEERVRSGLLSGSRVAIVIAPGWRDPNSGRLTAVALGSAPYDGLIEDGLWRGAEMDDDSLPDVIMLGTYGARTAIARTGYDPAEELSPACLKAGCQAVLAIRDDVPPEYVAAFAIAFAAGLAEGNSVATAAHTARGIVRDDAGLEGAPLDRALRAARIRVHGRGSYRPFPDGMADQGVASGMRRLFPILIGAALALFAAIRIRKSHRAARISG